MNRHQKKVLTLAGAIANLSFTCAVAGVATYAWFNENRDVLGSEISIQTSRDMTLEYKILKWNDEEKKGKPYTDLSEFVLPEYDEYIKARNIHSNIILRADITFGHDVDTSSHEIDIDIYKLATSALKGIDPEVEEEYHKIRKLTSNVAQFKCIATSYTLAPTELNPNPSATAIDIGITETHVANADNYKDDDDAMYQSATEYFATRKTPSTFISLMNGQPVDPENGNKITVVPELYNVGIIRKAVIYLECSYNESLATGFVHDHPDVALHDLDGDINKLYFRLVDFSNSKFGQNNTGKYIRMNNLANSYDGQYLTSYVTDNSQQVLDGSKTTGSETAGSSTGINSNNNQLGVSSFISNDKNNVYASHSIDSASLTFNRTDGTYKSENGHYVGNDTETEGTILSKSNGNTLHNSLNYDGYNASITSINQNTMQVKYDGTSKFAYYSSGQNSVNLYRFHENERINATLVAFDVVDATKPTGDKATFSVGQYFELRGLSCIATYRKSGGDEFTINVSSLCTYSTDPEGVLIPDKTTFTRSNDHKIITVSYSDGGSPFTETYELTVTADTLTKIEITSGVTKLLYRKGETFDKTGLVVIGTFSVAGEIDITNECEFYIDQVLIRHGQALNTVGDSIEVTVHYGGYAIIGPGYSDQTFSITVKDYVIDITETNVTLAPGENATIHFNYNGNISWTITGTTGALSFSSSDSTQTTRTTTYTGANYATASGTLTVYALAKGTATLTATFVGHESSRDTCQFVIATTEDTTFVAGVDKGSRTSSGQDEVTKNLLKMHCTSSALGRDDNYRFYSGSTLTFSSPTHTIVKIEFTLVSGSDGNPENISLKQGSSGSYSSTTATWEGSSQSIAFSLAAQVRATSVKITYEPGPVYTVSFNANGGGTGTMDSFEAFGNISLPVNGFTANSGKTFTGWKANNTGNLLQPQATYNVQSDVTFYAQWETIITWTVTYDANGGTGTMTDTHNPYNNNATVTVLANGFTAPTGLVFTGWNTKADGSGTSYAPSSTFSITSNVTLFAQWSAPVTYTVAYNANGGTGTMTDPNSPYLSGSSVATLTNTFTAPDGKQFKNWNTAADGSGTPYAENVQFVIGGNTILYAQWEDIPQPGTGYTLLSSLTAGDEVLIVATYNSSTDYCLPAATTTSASPAASITVAVTNNSISDNLDNNLFTVGGSSGAWTFQNSEDNYLANTTSGNTGVRIQSNSDTWNVTSTNDTNHTFKMVDSGRSRWLGVYNDQDWRSYNTSNAANYKGSAEAIRFFKKNSTGNINPILSTLIKTNGLLNKLPTNNTDIVNHTFMQNVNTKQLDNYVILTQIYLFDLNSNKNFYGKTSYKISSAKKTITNYFLTGMRYRYEIV